ncbi:TPA: hypothetical protein R1765_001960 [Campylobacter coli]|nr:hypothetical protein [Campylobacter coli]
MRYYSLVVNNQIVAKLDSNNPIAPRLVFNMGNYGDIMYSRPSTISLYNMPTSFFTDVNKYKNKTIQLIAGISSEGFTKKQGIDSTQSDTIYIGKIENVVTAWLGRETIVTFLINSIGKVEGSAYVAQIDRGEQVASKIKDLMSKYLQGKNYNITIDPSATNVTSQTSTTIPLNPNKKSIEGLRYFGSILSRFGLIMSISGQNIQIRKLEDYSSSTGITQIKAEDLLSQPVAEGIGLVKIEVALNPGLVLFSKISLPNNIPLAPSEDLASSGIGQVIRADAKGNLIMKGVYIIISVIHAGDSRNNDVQSWSTTLICQRQM